MKALVFEQHGDPAEVLHFRDVPMPEPRPGDVLVRMIASPINPSDLLVVQGLYGRLPKLPATPGFDGVGIVEKSGGGFMGWRVNGRRVAVLNARGGNWAEYVVIPARQAVPMPNGIPDEQAAMFFVNPATALVMTQRVLGVRPGDWLLQTAAGSAVGRMVIRLGRHFGFRTINVVRSEKTGGAIRQIGAEVIVNTTTEDLEARVHEITGGKGVPYALDAVGGELTAAVVRCLAPLGRLLVYGALSLQPMPLGPRELIVGSKKIEGFWLSDWARKQNPLKMLGLFRQIGRLMQKGLLTSEIGQTFALNHVSEAVRKAEEPGRGGKILFKIS